MMTKFHVFHDYVLTPSFPSLPFPAFFYSPQNAWDHPAIEYVRGDVCDAEAVARACEGIDCVFHLAAAVGPFHPKSLYLQVNYQGTLNVIEGCRKHRVPKLVMSSSPSTRFDGSDVDGQREDEMPKLPLRAYMQDYAETKAMGELAVTAACCDELLTIAVAPHQVSGCAVAVSVVVF